MYGLLLKNLQEYIESTYGEKKWEAIKDAFKLSLAEFPVKDVFPEGQLIKMGKKAMQTLDVKDEEFYEGMGAYFVGITENIGFFKFIEHLGRELRDFFLNLDNLHDYLKYTFPRMKPPSFFVQDETEKCKIKESYYCCFDIKSPILLCLQLWYCNIGAREEVSTFMFKDRPRRWPKNSLTSR